MELQASLEDFPPKWMVSFNRKGTSVSLSGFAQCPRVRYTTTGDYNCKNNSKGQKKQIIRVILLLLLQPSLLKIIERGWLIWLNLWMTNMIQSIRLDWWLKVKHDWNLTGDSKTLHPGSPQKLWKPCYSPFACTVTLYHNRHLQIHKHLISAQSWNVPNPNLHDAGNSLLDLLTWY